MRGCLDICPIVRSFSCVSFEKSRESRFATTTTKNIFVRMRNEIESIGECDIPIFPFQIRETTRNNIENIKKKKKKKKKKERADYGTPLIYD